MANQYANLMRMGAKLPREAKDEHGRLEAYEPIDEEREFVLVLAGNGVSQVVMAKLLRISKRTLQKAFKEELADAHDYIKAQMGASLVREGLAGNVAALRYWLGTHGGPEWRIPKESSLMPDVFDDLKDTETVHFYMPSNNRDKPEDLGDTPGPTIDGEATESNAA